MSNGPNSRAVQNVKVHCESRLCRSHKRPSTLNDYANWIEVRRLIGTMCTASCVTPTCCLQCSHHIQNDSKSSLAIRHRPKFLSERPQTFNILCKYEAVYQSQTSIWLLPVPPRRPNRLHSRLFRFRHRPIACRSQNQNSPPVQTVPRGQSATCNPVGRCHVP
jgi:hypothetical protein